MTEMSKKIFFMFFIFGGYVKSPKGKKKIKSHKDMDSYLCASYCLVCVSFISEYIR